MIENFYGSENGSSCIKKLRRSDEILKIEKIFSSEILKSVFLKKKENLFLKKFVPEKEKKLSLKIHQT